MITKIKQPNTGKGRAKRAPVLPSLPVKAIPAYTMPPRKYHISQDTLRTIHQWVETEDASGQACARRLAIPLNVFIETLARAGWRVGFTLRPIEGEAAAPSAPQLVTMVKGRLEAGESINRISADLGYKFPMELSRELKQEGYRAGRKLLPLARLEL